VLYPHKNISAIIKIPAGKWFPAAAPGSVPERQQTPWKLQDE
jgi:hypothetical protein